jgi:bifunctional non-homologous end joining protein LigD
VHVEDHPLDYATFEGSIPEGHYGAGDVIVWDRGVWIPQEDPAKAYAKGKLKFELQGEKLSGLWNLVRTHMPGKKENWFLIKHQDSAARPQDDYDVLSAEPDSVLSERTLISKPKLAAEKAKRRKRNRPNRANGPGPLTGARKASCLELIKPELATLVDRPGRPVAL